MLMTLVEGKLYFIIKFIIISFYRSRISTADDA